MEDPRKILTQETGPFDLIGDIHGCHDELIELLERLGCHISQTADGATVVVPKPGRKVIFLGDLVGRGPKIAQVLQVVMDMVEAKTALCVPGNHDVKLLRKLQGKPIVVKHGLGESLLQMEAQTEAFRQRFMAFVDTMVDHYVLDGGKLVVAHAGLKEAMQGRSGVEVREFALFGEKTGEIDAFGFPVRYNWAAEYHGAATVVYGHTPVPEAVWINNTIDIDTGCIFGGKLTALRYPERELVSVPARHTYWPGKPYLRKQA